MWFEKLVGFSEENPIQVRENLTLEGGVLTSKINNKSYTYGLLEVLTLKELKNKILLKGAQGSLSLSEVVADVQELHISEGGAGAMFQAASQFNLLEMVGASVSPEKGVGIYERDYTQGPACAIACGAGTIYRNYFVDVGNQIGQTKEAQVDCLEEIGRYFKNEKHNLWEMKNGYALVTKEGLLHIQEIIDNLDSKDYEKLKNKLKVGVQWNTEVTISTNKQLVSQIYCSALPVAYSNIEPSYWETFARIILEAVYEATFYAALKNYRLTGNNKLYLNLIGGAFGNNREWIFNAIENAIKKFKNIPLEVAIVSYRNSDPMVQDFVEKVSKKYFNDGS